MKVVLFYIVFSIILPFVVFLIIYYKYFKFRCNVYHD